VGLLVASLSSPHTFKSWIAVISTPPQNMALVYPYL
jgi:hypothetical protein